MLQNESFMLISLLGMKFAGNEHSTYVTFFTEYENSWVQKFHKSSVTLLFTIVTCCHDNQMIVKLIYEVSLSEKTFSNVI